MSRFRVNSAVNSGKRHYSPYYTKSVNMVNSVNSGEWLIFGTIHPLALILYDV